MYHGVESCQSRQFVTHIVMPDDSHRRTTELTIDGRAKVHKLTFNRVKTVDVIYADKKSKRILLQYITTTSVWYILRRTTLNNLGFTIISGLSVAEHIHGAIASC